MMENIVKTSQWKDFQIKASTIDKLATWCLQKHTQLLSTKYTPITNTINLLKSLIQSFTKKAIALQTTLLTLSQISQTKYKNLYYQQQIQQSLTHISTLKNNISDKYISIAHSSDVIKQLRQQLIQLKIYNIKTCLTIEQYQQHHLHQLSQQTHLHQKQLKNQRYQAIKNLITSRNYSPSSIPNLHQQNTYLQQTLFQQLNKKLSQKQFINTTYNLLKSKLKKQQQKSNIYGLAGSMLFKLSTKSPTYQKYTYPKLLIYDILKNKYNTHLKQQKKNTQQLIITKQQFLSFTPLQILGVIQLKGGLSTIINKISTSKNNNHHNSSSQHISKTNILQADKQNKQNIQ